MKKIITAITAILMTAASMTCAAAAPGDAVSSEEKVKADTVSSVGSVSKIFCVTAALQLQERGLLDIDSPVTEYVPDFTMADERYRDITVRMLMEHSSGLMGMAYGDGILYDDVDTDYHDRFLSILKCQRLKWEPGSISSYCNDGFTLLEIVVERVSGESFTDYVEKHIAQPLGLQSTGTSLRMYGRDDTADIYVGGVPHETDYCTAFGSGGIMSTAPELCRFGTAFFTGDDTLLSQESKDEMQKNTARDRYEDGFGLGWDAVNVSDTWDTDEDVRLVFKGGALYHQYAGLMVAPDEQVSVSVLMNGGGTEEVFLLTESLMVSALGEKGMDISFSEPEAMETCVEIPERYLGMADIYARADGIFKVAFPGGKYMEITELTESGAKPERYMYTTEDRFVRMEGEPGSDKFVQDSDQRLLEFTERDGNTYLCEHENLYTGGVERFINDKYFLQRVGEYPVSDEVQAAWQERDGRKYYITNLRWSNCFYNISPFGRLKTAEDAVGLAEVQGLGKTVRFTGADTAEGFVRIQGTAGSNLDDYEVYTEDGCEYMRTPDRALVMISEKDIPDLTADIHEIPLETGRAKWYNIAEMGLKSVTFDISGNAAVYVYDRFDKVVYSSFVKDCGSEVTLPENGKIMFAGESGARAGIG